MHHKMYSWSFEMVNQLQKLLESRPEGPHEQQTTGAQKPSPAHVIE